ncbi:MAG: hypothetical protein SVZ03_14255 [Spirochaetota bacterium]|nr:hypothetical protein [Spirochaetota bacterium]
MKKIVLLAGIVSLISGWLSNGIYPQERDEETPQSIELIEEVEKEQRFNISGFMDFQYVQYDFKSEESQMKYLFKENGAFVLNNFNLYFSFNVSDDLLAFSEIRFLFAPTGNEQLTPVDDGYVYIGDDSNAVDHIIITPYNNLTSDSQATRFKYGSLFIERAYFEWNKLSFANLRLGRYLVPYGIWSQDHGAPVVTSVRVPLMVNTPLISFGMPQRQTGIELLGKVNLPSTSIFLDYAAYIGNGISDSDATADEADKNKAYGGFLNFKLPLIAKMIDIELGCSGYQGERTFICKKIAEPFILSSINDGTQSISYNIDYSDIKFYYKQLDTIALAHVKVSIGSLPFDGTLIIQSEFMRQWVDEKSDESRLVDIWGQPRKTDDSYFFGSYFQIEYQIFGKITPYFRYERLESNTIDTSIALTLKHANMYTVGLNVKPYDEVVIKTEWLRFDAASASGWIKIEMDGTVTPYVASEDVDQYSVAVSFSF